MTIRVHSERDLLIDAANAVALTVYGRAALSAVPAATTLQVAAAVSAGRYATPELVDHIETIVSRYRDVIPSRDVSRRKTVTMADFRGPERLSAPC